MLEPSDIERIRSIIRDEVEYAHQVLHRQLVDSVRAGLVDVVTGVVTGIIVEKLSDLIVTEASAKTVAQGAHQQLEGFRIEIKKAIREGIQDHLNDLFRRDDVADSADWWKGSSLEDNDADRDLPGDSTDWRKGSSPGDDAADRDLPY